MIKKSLFLLNEAYVIHSAILNSFNYKEISIERLKAQHLVYIPSRDNARCCVVTPPCLREAPQGAVFLASITLGRLLTLLRSCAA